MSKIIINGRFLTQKMTGVQRYAREITTALDKFVEKEQVEIVVPPEAEELPAYKNIKIVKVGIFHNRMWEHISFPLYVMKCGGIALNLCNVAPLLSPGIVCIHDVKIKAHPEFFSAKFLIWYKLLFFNAMKRARFIITVSEFSKNEIMKYYHVDSNKIAIVPNGWQHFKRINFNETTLKKYNLLKEEYYFAMSSLEPNKNFKWIADMANNNPNEKFVIAGAINEKIFAEGLGFRCPDNMKLIGYISDEEAKTLMRDCKAFLFPSIYEGFGIPPLEAMSAGAKHIIVSDIPVMHEIFGDSVEYIVKKNYIKFNDKKINIRFDDILKKYNWSKSSLKLKNIIERKFGYN